MSSASRPLEVWLDLTVKTYDIDFAGIVSNIVYIRWLEDLRVQMIKQVWPLPKQLAEDIAPILSQTTIQYKRPVQLQDSLRACMWMSRLKKLKWTVSAEFQVDRQLVATAEQSGCFINLRDRRPIRVPDHIIQQYEALRMEGRG